MFTEGKHFLQKGQSAVEYLVTFSAIAAVTLLSVCSFYPDIHKACETAFEQAAGEIVTTAGELGFTGPPTSESNEHPESSRAATRQDGRRSLIGGGAN